MAVALAAGAPAAVVGFVEDFNMGAGGFMGGSQNQVVAAGGVGGAADGYLRVTNVLAANMGVFSDASELTGDLAADGVTGFRVWLSELGSDDGIEIHVGIGQPFTNYWVANIGFDPPTDGWAAFEVDLTDESQWTRVLGGGTFADAVANHSRLLLRHDMAPIQQLPPAIAGDFGVDRVEVLGAADCPGDCDGSGLVDIDDLLLVLGSFGTSGPAGDCDGSGTVDIDDLLLVLGNFGATC